MKILILILASLAIVLVSGCVGDFVFKYGEGHPEFSETYSIDVYSDTVVFSGRTETPSPCYSVSANHKVTEGEIIIFLEKAPKVGACNTEGAVKVPFAGYITNLNVLAKITLNNNQCKRYLHILDNLV